MRGFTNFSVKTVISYLQDGFAVDGSKGGLLLGRSHDAGGIPLFMLRNGEYCLMHEIEGGEYILNITTQPQVRERLEILNNGRDQYEVLIGDSIPAHIRTIDCYKDDEVYSEFYLRHDAKFLVLDSNQEYFIINRHSSWKHLDLLEQINRELDSTV